MKQRIESYSFTPKDSVFIDANIWLFLYSPLGRNDPRTAIYSASLKQILSAGTSVYIDVLVMSEFVNRFARFEWEMRGGLQAAGAFKAFRRSQDYRPVGQSIAAALKAIFKIANRLDSGFKSLLTETFLSEFEAANHDFNDHIIAGLCADNGLTLVTDDADFKEFDITILTANRRLAF